MKQNATPKNVIVFVDGLGGGGAERVAVRVSGWLRDAGHRVCLLTLSSADTDFYPCPQDVGRIALDLQRPSRNPMAAVLANLSRLLAVRRAVRVHRADTVVSLGDRSNVLMLLATMGLAGRKIISERSDPVLVRLSHGWGMLRRLTYPLATLHISQSSYVSEWLEPRFPALPCRVIGNACDLVPAASKKTAREGHAPIRLVALGRLSKPKGIDLLLEAYALAVRASRIPMELRIVGDGEERDALVAQAESLGLGAAVAFLGRTLEVQDTLASGDIYLLPSRWEGFPNALIEAMTVGLPVIVARCQGGVEDILGNEKERYGLDFPPGDTAALADCIVRLTTDVGLRQRLAKRSLERAADYSPERISAAWRDVVEQP